MWEQEEKVTCDCEEAHGNALSPVQYRDNTSLTLVAQSTTRKHGLVVRNETTGHGWLLWKILITDLISGEGNAISRVRPSVRFHHIF